MKNSTIKICIGVFALLLTSVASFAQTTKAKRIDFAKEGMKVIITGGRPLTTSTSSMRYYLEGEGHLPPVSAKSFFVADVDQIAVDTQFLLFRSQS